jgi:hypothetical protein
MNVAREMVLESSLQQTLTEFASLASEVQRAAALPGGPLPHGALARAAHAVGHAGLLSAMLSSARPIVSDVPDPQRRADALAFCSIADFFAATAGRFRDADPVCRCDFAALVPELERVLGRAIAFADDFVPSLSVRVCPHFFVKIVFTFDREPAFVVAHAAAEAERSPFEQSAFRVFRTLSVYVARVLPDFTAKYGQRGVVDFVTWLQCYDGLFSTPCAKCGQFMKVDATGDILPPIVRSVASCGAFHIRCAPREIELPEFAQHG